jgi:hypothetical protein
MEKSSSLPDSQSSFHQTHSFPRSGIIGFIVMLIAWIMNWLPSHPISSFAFILTWIGFIFFLDGLVFLRQGKSIWSTSPAKFLQLFLFSAPVWWLFEAYNSRIQNWHYTLDRPFGLDWNPFWYNIMSTLCFSTVLPAVMTMSCLLATFAPFRSQIRNDNNKTNAPRSWLIAEGVIGIIGLITPIIWPQYCFGLVWLGPLMTLDVINALAKRRAAITYLYAGNWRIIILLAVSSLICGFFWEFWNYFALPRWYYTVPLFSQAIHFFEMPIPGYIGYLPFGVELFAMYQFLLWIANQKDDALLF